MNLIDSDNTMPLSCLFQSEIHSRPLYSKVDQSEAAGVTPCALHRGGGAAGEGEGGGGVLYVPVFECLKI